MTRLYYEHGDDAQVYLYFDYDLTAIDAIKTMVPRSHRRWNPDRRCWVVSEPYWPRLRKILLDYGVFGKAEEFQSRAPTSSGAWATLYLKTGAPPEVVTAAYRALAKLHHPDLADPADANEVDRRTRKMTELNLAYEKLREGK